MVRLFVELG